MASTKRWLEIVGVDKSFVAKIVGKQGLYREETRRDCKTPISTKNETFKQY